MRQDLNWIPLPSNCSIRQARNGSHHSFRHQVPEAANRSLTESYIQHNPNVADGRQAFIDAFTLFLKKTPERSWSPKRIFVDGDYVIVHGLYKNNAEDRGTAAVDIFRIKDGKIDEHWDVQQPVPEKAANPHPMFSSIAEGRIIGKGLRRWAAPP